MSISFSASCRLCTSLLVTVRLAKMWARPYATALRPSLHAAQRRGRACVHRPEPWAISSLTADLVISAAITSTARSVVTRAEFAWSSAAAAASSFLPSCCSTSSAPLSSSMAVLSSRSVSLEFVSSAFDATPSLAIADAAAERARALGESSRASRVPDSITGASNARPCSLLAARQSVSAAAAVPMSSPDEMSITSSCTAVLRPNTKTPTSWCARNMADASAALRRMKLRSPPVPGLADRMGSRRVSSRTRTRIVYRVGKVRRSREEGYQPPLSPSLAA
mmetsp:Transcript_61215/g.167876  ORF Transcript_61215/g.167876 Transcript_61215/m.167876 type:complete len:279 (+) Transcript_61215:1327-2163(+)